MNQKSGKLPCPTPEGATPAMAQWFALKAQEPDALLFFRMGDFFELFFQDAEAASVALDISLTTRGKHQDTPIPMCGVPVAAAASYIAKLIRRDFRVAIAEQIDTPPKKGEPAQKGPLKRAIVRLVTRGTLTEDELLEASKANILLSLVRLETRAASAPIGAAWIDVSTGDLETTILDVVEIDELLARIDPVEILTDLNDFVPEPYRSHVVRDLRIPDLDIARLAIARRFGLTQIGSLGAFMDEEIVACATILAYIKRTLADNVPRVSRPNRHEQSSALSMDPSTRASLELLAARDGTTTHTLLSAVDRTYSAGGKRLLSRWISSPLIEPGTIAARQEAWKWLARTPSFLDALQDVLKHTPDLARALTRLSSGRLVPRDLGAVKSALLSADRIVALLRPVYSDNMPEYIRKLYTGFHRRADPLLNKLEAALKDELPARLEDGNVISANYDTELDAARALRDNSRQAIVALQAQYAARYNVGSLKIKYHAQLGYVIETTSTHANRLREDRSLIFRQGTANLARFSTDELTTLERAIIEAADRAQALEVEIFTKLAHEALDHPALTGMAELFSLSDALAGAAELSQEGVWCCPEVTTDRAFEIEACRHPVVEAALDDGTHFIPNDCALPPENRVMLLTGPNMAGKSTFLRQTALAVVLAQAGLPIPARRARIGIVDRLFSRVGASDDLARGRSTFMVEMSETAAILRLAGPRSFVVVDEIGRGTSTLDGLAIAWATLEALHSQLGSRTIFATHFHELGRLTDSMPHLTPYTMMIKEWKGTIVFQHEVRKGAARKSWGIHVARLAGVPDAVVNRATRLLAALEAQHPGISAPLPLFEPTTPSGSDDITITDIASQTETLKADATSIHKVISKLEALDPDSLTPRDALATLYELQRLAQESGQARPSAS